MSEKLTDAEKAELFTLPDTEGKKWLELESSLEKLQHNQDFKRVIEEGYLKEFAIRQTSLMFSDNIQNRSKVIEHLISIANFESYIRTIKNMASYYKQQLKQQNSNEKSPQGAYNDFE